jgi:hypothetical protein
MNAFRGRAAARSSRRLSLRSSGMSVVLSVVLVAALLAIASPARAAEDATPPQITAFSVAPAVINTEFADQTVTVTVTLTDDLSGVASMGDGSYFCSISYMPSSGMQAPFNHFTRISGDDHDGVYAATLTFPCGSAVGEWNVNPLALWDKAGNSVSLHPHDLAAKFGAGCGAVTNIATTADTTPPEVTAFSITPKEFNTEAADQTLTVTMTLTDAQSGVRWGQVSLTPASIPSAGLYQVATGMGTRVSGDDHNGVYTVIITVPKWSKEGAWRVHSLGLTDNIGNWVQLTTADLAAKLGADCVTVENTATVSDTTPPQITAFSITPNEFNTEAAGQTITATMTLTDAQSGVSSQGDSGVVVSSLGLIPLIGSQRVDGNFTRISGDDHNGVYTAALALPKWGKEGVWLVEDLRMADKAGNGVELNLLANPEALHALLPGADSFVVNTATAQQVTIDRLWTLSSAGSSVTFPAGTVVTRADNGRFAFYEMAAQPFTLDDTLPTDGLDGTPVATLRFGIPGLNLSFDRPVTVSMAVGYAYEDCRLSIQSLTEGADAWANETSCTVQDGCAVFTVSHATRFVGSPMKPTFTGLSPTSGRRGTTITLTGKGFGALRGTSTVKFGAKVCTRYVSWRATRIKVKVPAKAAFGTLKVTVKTSVGASNTRSFRVKR